LLERDSFDLLLPAFDKPWVIHLRETCCCSTNLCTWRPNTVYKDISVHRYHTPSAGERRERGLGFIVSELVVGEDFFWIRLRAACVRLRGKR
jgi:hypothetical protein